jgi:hypothetical protein
MPFQLKKGQDSRRAGKFNHESAARLSWGADQVGTPRCGVRSAQRADPTKNRFAPRITSNLAFFWTKGKDEAKIDATPIESHNWGSVNFLDPICMKKVQFLPRIGWHELIDDNLMVMTIHDSEPWVEAWQTTAGLFKVVQRIT